jgi:NTP pyrophosphatase (non-canonical NTP hydrolase)
MTLTLAEAQAQADALIHQLGGYWPPLANLARLFEECGELARLVNQQYGPKRRKEGEATAALADELGDVLFLLAVLANSMQIDLESSLLGAIAKYQTRDVEAKGEAEAR